MYLSCKEKTGINKILTELYTLCKEHENKFMESYLYLINSRQQKILKEVNSWLEYELPPHLLGKIWKGKYRGQTQKWFIVRFIGNDKEINLKTKKPEFIEWRWISHKLLTEVIVDFKKNVYKKLEVEISDFIN